MQENPCQHPVIILKGVSFVDLQAVVTFMYNGQVNVTQERLSCFLQTAEMLQIKGLTDMNDKDTIGGEELHQAPSLPISRHTNPNSVANKVSNKNSSPFRTCTIVGALLIVTYFAETTKRSRRRRSQFQF